MNLSKLNSLINELESVVSEFRKLTLSSEKIQIATVWQEDITYVHYWDPRNPEPRVFASVPFQLEEEKLSKILCSVLNLLTPTAHRLGVEWVGDFSWESLPENFEKLEQVFNIEHKELTEDQREYIRGTQYALYNLSSELPVQGSN
jgi:hypothetical protein